VTRPKRSLRIWVRLGFGQVSKNRLYTFLGARHQKRAIHQALVLSTWWHNNRLACAASPKIRTWGSTPTTVVSSTAGNDTSLTISLRPPDRGLDSVVNQKTPTTPQASASECFLSELGRLWQTPSYPNPSLFLCVTTLLRSGNMGQQYSSRGHNRIAKVSNTKSIIVISEFYRPNSNTGHGDNLMNNATSTTIKAFLRQE
jgi:hypothetical protein